MQGLAGGAYIALPAMCASNELQHAAQGQPHNRATRPARITAALPLLCTSVHLLGGQSKGKRAVTSDERESRGQVTGDGGNGEF